MIIDEWRGAYPSNWAGLIVPDAIAHPAKYSSKLIRRIYDHLAEEGWVTKGSSVVDPFGGVALGAFDAMRLGLKWRGVELEPRFAVYGNQNIELWNTRFGKMPVWGEAALLCGDSRKLVQVLVDHKYFKVVVSSPPYADGSQHTGGDDKHPEHIKGGAYYGVGIAASVSSPPYAEAIKTTENGSGIDYSKSKTGGKGRTKGRENIALGYGSESGQLGSMKSTEQGFSAAISSPPFQGNSGGKNVTAKEGVLADVDLLHRHAAGNSEAGYGESEGNLGSLVPTKKGFEVAVSSPPWEQNGVPDHDGQTNALKGGKLRGGGDGFLHKEYGNTDGQLGSNSGDDFWLSARTIVEQVYQVLAPGAHAVWVVKDYVKGGKIVPFVDQWRQLCEAVGFETLHEHHAMLVHSRQSKLEGGEHVRESKSFFRRLAEKKGSPRIDYEVVLCMIRL